MKWSKIFIDPSSGEPSMSRVCFGVLVLNIICMAWARMLGLNPSGFEKAMAPLVTALGIDAGVYLSNSAAGAWKRPKPPQEEKTEEPVG